MSGSAELKWGSGLIGFSPVACLFFLVVTKRPELVIIAILGYVCRYKRRARSWQPPRPPTLHARTHASGRSPT